MRRGCALAATIVALAFPARAETLAGALLRAYDSNPSLSAARAELRAIDESVPQARAGMRPKIGADAYLGAQRNRSVSRQADVELSDPLHTQTQSKSIETGSSMPRSAGVRVEQPLFDGFRAQNETRAAESGVFAGRERLRLTEQRVLFDAASAYMSVLRDTAALKLQESNVSVLAEQLRQVRERYLAGQITLTDIAQAEARLAGGKAMQSTARAALDASLGAYRQVVGVEPKRLTPAPALDRLLPKSREAAEKAALAEHPVVLAALHDVDSAEIGVKVIESDYMPRLSIVGDIFTQTDTMGVGNRNIGAMIGGKLNVPIYEGGVTSSRLRQAKETTGQRRFDADTARAEVLSLVRANWGAWQAAKERIAAAQKQADAAERALLGVREEAKAGQRTTLDILNAQQELLAARIGLLAAQRDRVVAAYAVLAATGRLSVETLGLRAARYDPGVHFDQVKDDWGQPLTPDGR